MNAGRREDALRLLGSGGANRAMEAELMRLVKRSPFRVRVPAPRRDGDATLLYAFDPHVAWVAAAYHRTSSRVHWDLWSSPALRLEPLFEDLRPLASEDERLPGGALRVSVEVKAVEDFEAGPLQVRGAVKNAILESRPGWTLDAEAPDLVFAVRRGGPGDDRRTVISLDLGGGARHRRGDRVAMVEAPLRETLAAQLLVLARWDPRSEVLVDPMAGGGTIPIEAAKMARGVAVRQPRELVLPRLPAFAELPLEAPPLFADTRPVIAALDADAAAIAPLIGNLRAAGLTGPEHEGSLVVGTQDARELRPEALRRLLPRADLSRGLFAFNPPYGRRLEHGAGEEGLTALYRDLGRALERFPGFRVALFVANPAFIEAFGRRPAMVKPGANAGLPGSFLVYDAPGP